VKTLRNVREQANRDKFGGVEDEGGDCQRNDP